VSVAGFIAAQRAQYRIPHATTCRALGLSQAWFYKWRHGDRLAATRPPRAAGGQDQAAVRRPQGSLRIAPDHRRPARGGLAGQCEHGGPDHGRAGLAGPAEALPTPNHPPGSTAPDLVGRDFAAATINHKWYGDGTEIGTEEGKRS
jgi:hypothetical protein